jgi:hypothetical protein
MTVEPFVQEFLTAFSDGGSTTGMFADDFQLVGEARGAPVLAFGVPGASLREVMARNMAITFDGVAVSSCDHALVWGTAASDGDEPATYHVVLTVQCGRIAEARFFDDMERARWYAGL